MKKIYLFSLLILYSCLNSVAQPSNDECTGAISLGTLPTPAACPGTGAGTQVTYSGTIVGATPEATYIYQTSCSGAGGTTQSFPANDVWYSFVASGYQLVATVTSTFANPNIAMYAGSCASLGGGVGGCAVGAGGTVTLTVEQMVIGTTYYLQISGNTTQSGTFNLTIQNNKDCSDCLSGSTLTATPPPVNGAYDPGQTVNFCFHVSTWNTVNTNWLHGVQLVFGSGWNTGSLTTTPPATLQTTGGVWSYYPGGCTSSATGTTFGPGFYFDGSTVDGTPGNNFGDLNPTTTVGAGDWNFCFSITTNAGCSPGSDLSVTINTTGDGESGSWSSIGCVDDPNTIFHAVGSCCPPTMTSTATTCAGNDGTATATPVGSAGPYDYSWTNSGGTVISTATAVAGANTVSGLAPGTYTVSIINAFNCAITNTVTVANGGTPPAVPTAGSNSPICQGSTLNLTAANVTGGSYSWSGPNGFASTSQNPSITGATTAASGTYTVTVSTGGCTNTSSTVVTVNSNPTVTVSPTTATVCPGDPVSLTASGATTYSWSPATGLSATSGANVTASPTTTSTYVVTGTTSGCTGSASTTITVANNLSVSVSPTTATVCPGDPVTLTASGSATAYSWSPSTGLSSTTGATVTASPATTTTYTVTGTNGGCSGSTTVTVNVVNNLTVAVSPTSSTVCPGDPVTLTASGGATNYTWSPSTGLSSTTGASVVASPTVTTTYTVTGTTGGCSASASATVNVVNNLSISVAPANPSICLNSNVTLTASGATNYTWSPSTGLSSTSGASVIASPTTTTTYTVTGTTGGCSATASATVNIAPGLTITVNPNPTSICPGANVVLTAAGGNTYSWSPATGLSSTSGTSVTANPITTTTYSVTGTDAAGCSGSTTVTVNVDPISATTVSTDENCGQANGSATVTPSGNCPAGFTYQWSSVPVQTSTTASNLPAGTYTVSVYCGLCLTTATATINNLPGPSVAIIGITNTTCSQANGGATANASGGNAPYTYLWSSGQSGQNLTNVVAGTYYVTVTDANSCQAMNTVVITDSPGPSASITGITNAACGFSDGSATVSASGGAAPYTYSWSNSTSSQTLSNVPTGLYTVTVTDANSCTTSTSVSVGEDPGPSATSASTNEICDQLNGTATVSASGGTGTYTYLWSDGQTTPTAIGLAQGTYTVTISDGGCSTVETVGVLETPGPSAGFSANPQVLTIMDGPVSFLDHSSGNITNWSWSFGDGTASSGGNDPIHLFENIGTYLVTLIVTDNNGCMDTISDTIKVKEIFTFYIPSAFTPNNDGTNDTWTPKGLSVDPEYFEMFIFDRWGNQLFYSTEWNYTLNQGGEPWNGTKDNLGTFNDVVMDVYVYRILCKEIDGPKHEYIGRISLIP